MTIADTFYRELTDAIADGSGTAWTDYGKTQSYDDLHQRVRRIAAFLRGRRRAPVLVYSDKTFAAYAAVFGTLLSGNIWIPMSPTQPAARNVQILRMTKARLILTDSALPDALAEAVRTEGVEVVDLDRLTREGDDSPIAPPAMSDDDIAYIMFTSGSTGTPKGVPMTHANYISFVRNALSLLPLTASDVFSDYHDWGFDISVFYLFCAPMAGAALAPATRLADRALALRYIQENRITVWSSVPSSIARIRQMYPRDLPKTDLKVMFLCGEPFSLKVLDYCLNNLRVPHIYNFYGLTETGVENFWHTCAATDLTEYERWGFVPIGLPLPGSQILVGDDKELLLSGCQITPGYLEGIGHEKFEMLDGVRWFRTGDIVEQHKGVWFCKGRIDSQIKISGYRVELMDVEVNIKRLSGVEEAVCFLSNRNDHPQLVAVLLPRPGAAELDAAALKSSLAQALPPYMIPSRFHVAAEMPVNQNGKIDRRQVKNLWSEA
jgi:amino acid adenylation domain-containing protein